MEKGEREGVGETDIEGETGTELGNSVEGEGKGKKETERARNGQRATQQSWGVLWLNSWCVNSPSISIIITPCYLASHFPAKPKQ